MQLISKYCCSHLHREGRRSVTRPLLMIQLKYSKCRKDGLNGLAGAHFLWWKIADQSDMTKLLSKVYHFAGMNMSTVFTSTYIFSVNFALYCTVFLQ